MKTQLKLFFLLAKVFTEAATPFGICLVRSFLLQTCVFTISDQHNQAYAKQFTNKIVLKKGKKGQV